MYLHHRSWHSRGTNLARKYPIQIVSLLILLSLLLPAWHTRVQAASTSLVISQFQVAGSSSADEFVEIHNVSNSAINLNSYKLVYRSISGTSDVIVIEAFPSYSLAAGKYYLVAASGYDGTVAANVTYGDEKFSGTAGGLAIKRTSDGAIVDSLGYGNGVTNNFVEGAAVEVPYANKSEARKSSGCQDTDNNQNDFERKDPSAPRNTSSPAVICGTAASCSSIPQIQGEGTSTSCSAVSNIPGCITGIAVSGFYFQDESGDGTPNTSDGLYVYKGGSWTNTEGLKVGDKVKVSGSVIEYYDTTEIQYATVTKVGICTVPAAIEIFPLTDPEVDPTTLYEKYEGMRVKMSFDGWVVGPTKRFESRYEYGDPEIAFVDFSSSIMDYTRIMESDFPGYQGVNYLSGALGYDLPDLDSGDDIAGTYITGILGYTFDKYELLVDSVPALTTVDNEDEINPQEAASPTNGQFDICYANVENLFDSVNDATDDEVYTAAEYDAKLTATAEILVNDAKSCMLIGLEEMEGKQSVYNALAAKLNTLDLDHTWSAGYVESGDSRDISQGFLWRNDVSLVGSITPVSGEPYESWVTDGALDFERTPVSGTFRFNSGMPNQVDIHAYAVHLKSKRSSTECSADDCTDKREKEAADMRDILAHHNNAGEYAIAGGDFNDVIGSTPIEILNESADIYGPWNEAEYHAPHIILEGQLEAGRIFYTAPYSYIFSGESEVLDHMYITANLKDAPGYFFNAVHVNADFPTVEHASDHDPIRIIFYTHGANLEADATAKSAKKGSVATYTLTITNNGYTADTFAITQSGAAWPVGITPASVTLDPGASATITIKVFVPFTAAVGSFDMVTITATSAGDPSRLSNVTLTTTALSRN
ncbi:MAG: lamin tail domain-containing protein [Chloroflexi bacterium]|nr:lamin tail domain-containing protein [Chloroflexota bacterium]